MNPYVDPNTRVKFNRLGITDSRVLQVAEYRLLQVIDLRDGRPIASFTSDESWSAAAFADDNLTIVAADVRGAVHFLRLVAPTLGKLSQREVCVK